MSFGWSGGDVFLLTQLAWNTVQNSRKACGEYDELTREALRLHAVLQRLEQEVAIPDSPINRAGGTSTEQLERIATDCEVVLKQVDKIVMAYAALSEEKRSVRKIWQRVRFGNGQMADLGDLRSKLTLYTSEMLLYLNFVSMSTVGRIEQRMERDGGVLRDIKIAVEKKTAHTVLCGGDREGTILTTYTNDDTGFWKGLRRDLVKEGLPSAAINKHKHLIKRYIKELGDRGILDDHSSQEFNQQQYDTLANSEIIEEVEQLPNDSSASFNVTQTLDHNPDAQLLEDLDEQSPHDSLNDTVGNDRESKSSHADSCATVLQTLGEQSYEATDKVGITPGAKFKSQPRSSNSSLREPTRTGNEPQNVPSTRSVPSMHGKERPRTSMNEANTIRTDTENASDAKCCAGQDSAVYDESSHDVLFPFFFTELRIDFVVTSSGICYHRNMEAYRKDVHWLYVYFGQRIDDMLECLPNRCVPECSLQSPQTEPGYDQSYIADVQIIASYAQVAQEIIRDICDLKCTPPNLLNDFRSKDFIDALVPNSGSLIQDLWLGRRQPFLTRIYELIEGFDRQCYDAVHRMRLRISTKKGAEQAAEARQCIQDRREKERRKEMELKSSSKFNSYVEEDSSDTEKPVPLSSSNQNSRSANYQSSPNEKEVEQEAGVLERDCRRRQRDKDRRRDQKTKLRNNVAPSLEDDYEVPIPVNSSNLRHMRAPSDTSDSSSESDLEEPPPRPRAPPTPNEKEVEQEAGVLERDCRRRQRDKDRRRDQETKLRNNVAPSLEDDYEVPIPVNSSNLRHMRAPSDTSDSTSESDLEEPPPRPRAPPIRSTKYGFSSQEGAYVIESEVYPTRLKESHRASERLGPRVASTRSLPMARARRWRQFWNSA